jgi:phenylpropionate dioxygenase-like ring-hydroxylating dioxygenase large terminal subunit
VFENAIDMAHSHYLLLLSHAANCLQGEIEFECGHWGVFENAIDMAHIHYLHNDSFGNSEKPHIHNMTTTRDTFHVEAQFRCGCCCW